MKFVSIINTLNLRSNYPVLEPLATVLFWRNWQAKNIYASMRNALVVPAKKIDHVQTASIKYILTINLIISTISINYQKQNAITSPFYKLSIRAWNYTLLSNEAYDVCGCLEWFYPSTIWTRNNHTPFPLLFPLLLLVFKDTREHPQVDFWPRKLFYSHLLKFVFQENCRTYNSWFLGITIFLKKF